MREIINDPSIVLWEALMEEKFFFLYNMRLPPELAMAIPINERKWYMHRFVVQKERENAEIEKARKKK